MKKLNILILVLAVFTLQSCFDVVEKVTMNKNGSGAYELSYDFSSMMGNGMMKDMLKQSMESEEGPMGNMMVDGSIEVDTVISLQDSPMMEEIDSDMSEVMKKAKMAMRMSEAQGVFKMVMSLDFDQVSEIAEFHKALQSSGDGQQGLGTIMPATGLFELNGKTLTRKAIDLSSAKAMMEGNEEMEMMKMMMTGATYTTVYEFPKKVKSTSMKDAEVGKKTVTVTRDFLNILEGKGNLAGKIKFK